MTRANTAGGLWKWVMFLAVRTGLLLSALVRHARRLVFQLAEVAVLRVLFQGVLDRIGRLFPMKEEGFSSLAGRGSLGEVRLLRRPPELTVDRDPRCWHRPGRTKIAPEGWGRKLTGIQRREYPVPTRLD